MSCHSTHVGIAATQHAKAVTSLDDAQVSSVFHRLKQRHKDAPAPSPEHAVATLTRMRREVTEDVRLPEATRTRIAARLDRALADAAQGTVPDGRTFAAMQQTVQEAESAERILNHTLRAAARHQRTSEDRLAATFRKWRRTSDYEDLESPDPAFRLDPDQFPADKHTRRALRKLGFENYLAQRLPVFVYGTLRNAQGNDRLMTGAIAQRSEDAEVHGVAVYGASWGFPYATEAPDGHGITRGDLVYLSDDADGDWARQSLDNLEGFDSDDFHDSHYRRVAREVTYTDPDTGERKTVQAWTYLAGRWSQDRCTEAERIPDGDWVAAKRAHRATTPRRRAYWDDWDDTTDTAATTATSDADSFTGEITYTKRAVDPNPPSTSAADSAAVFATAGLINEEPPDDAGWWSQYH